MKKSCIVTRLNALGLDKNEYWVVAGSAMVMHGLRSETNDIDLGCTSALADELISRGYSTFLNDDGTRKIIIGDDIEVFENWLFDKVVFVNEIPTISLTGLLEMKLSLNREKDQRDIRLINAHLLMKNPPA